MLQFNGYKLHFLTEMFNQLFKHFTNTFNVKVHMSFLLKIFFNLFIKLKLFTNSDFLQC